MIEKVVLGFGSNKGNRYINLKNALKNLSLNRYLDLLAVSKIYETEPWGYKKQNSFLNCAAVFLCRLSALELIVILKKYEVNAGRTKNEKWKEREIDIDILFYGNRIINSKKLKIPHLYLHERNFVLAPLVELIPGYVHPKLKKSIKNLYLSSKDNCKVNSAG